MITAATQSVKCVEGCAQSGDGLTLILGGLGLLVALISAFLAWGAMHSSHESAKAAEASLKIAEEQHAEFMKERHARADFKLKMYLSNYSDGVVETKADRIKVLWTLEVVNVGDKPATHVSVHFEAPADVQELKWVMGENDSLQTQRAGPFRRVGRKIFTSGGKAYASQFLTKVVDRIGTRKGPRFSQVSGYVDVPSLGEERVFPAELSVWSDEMGDEPMRTVSLDVTVRRII